MPLAAAVIGSAVVGAVATNSAANKAVNAAESATNANTQLIQANQARADQYMQPYVNAGGAALSPLQALITGGGYAQQAGQGGGGQSDGTPKIDTRAYFEANPDALANFQELQASGRTDAIATDPQAFVQNHWQTDGQRRELPMAKPQTMPGNDARRDTQATYGPGVPTRETYTRPDVGTAPDSASYFTDFQADPGYQWAVDQALRAVKTKAGASGKYFSGARDIALQDRAVNLANQQYGDWWNRKNALLVGDRGQYNTDRATSNTNYIADRAYGTDIYNTDLNYNTNRFDKQVSDLFSLAGLGANSASAAVGAGTNTTNALTGQNTALAGVQGNAAIAGANGVSNAVGNALTAYGMFGQANGVNTGSGYSTGANPWAQQTGGYVGTPSYYTGGSNALRFT